MKKRAFSYLRFSKGIQAKGRSEDRQGGNAQAYCERQGWTLDATLYADRGVSGYRGKNAATGQLGAFLAAIQQGKVKPGDVLIVESLDRLSRQDIDDAFDLFRGILKTGVEIVTLDPERHYDRTALKSITGIIEPLVIMARANEESAMKSARIRDAWHHKRLRAQESKRPVNYACPKWLQGVRKDGKVVRFIPIPERVAVVKRIFQMCIDGQGCIAISRTLNKEGVEAFGVRQWAYHRVNQILRSRTVLGEFQPKERDDKGGRRPAGKPVLDYYSRIIDDETFWRAQRVTEGRKRLVIRGREGKGVANLFTHLLWSVNDNCALQYQNTTVGKYLTSEKGRGGKVKACSFRYDIFEEGMIWFLKNLIVLKGSDKGTATADRERWEAELTDCDARIKRTQAAMADADKDLWDNLTIVLKQQTNNRKAILAQLDQARAKEQADPQGELESTKSVLVQYLEALDRQKAWEDIKETVKKGSQVKEDKQLENEADAELFGDFRAQLKNKIRGLVKEIRVHVEAKGWHQKYATIEVQFHHDGVKAFRIRCERDGAVYFDHIPAPWSKKG